MLRMKIHTQIKMFKDLFQNHVNEGLFINREIHIGYEIYR